MYGTISSVVYLIVDIRSLPLFRCISVWKFFVVLDKFLCCNTLEFELE